MDGLIPSDALALAKASLRKQRAYEKQRRAWAREIGHPIQGHETEPPPGVIDAEDPELG